MLNDVSARSRNVVPRLSLTREHLVSKELRARCSRASPVPGGLLRVKYPAPCCQCFNTPWPLLALHIYILFFFFSLFLLALTSFIYSHNSWNDGSTSKRKCEWKKNLRSSAGSINRQSFLTLVNLTGFFEFYSASYRLRNVRCEDEKFFQVRATKFFIYFVLIVRIVTAVTKLATIITRRLEKRVRVSGLMDLWGFFNWDSDISFFPLFGLRFFSFF